MSTVEPNAEGRAQTERSGVVDTRDERRPGKRIVLSGFLFGGQAPWSGVAIFRVRVRL